MAKFKLYHDLSGTATGADYDGDYMQQDKQFIKIFRRAKNPSQLDEQVASIHLDKGYSLRKVSD